MKLSIVIATMNRSDFLIRALKYYRSVGFKGVICIGDSSSTDHTEKIKGTIKEIGKDLNIIYRYYANPPYFNDAACVKELLELALTPYAVQSGDDDFLIPGSLEKCINFLEENQDYSAAHGLRVAIRLKNSGAYGEVIEAHNCHQLELNSDKASERWTAYMRHGVSVLYSVHRTDALRLVHRYNSSVNLRYIGNELLPTSLFAISGKIKELDCLSIVFQVNDTHPVATDSFYSLTMNPEWPSAVKVLKNAIVEDLTKKDGLNPQCAEELFEREFWRHILMFLHWQYKIKYNEVPYDNPILKVLKSQLKKIPGFLGSINFVVAKINNYKNRSILGYTRPITLNVLLDPHSSFYNDFYPVYKIITENSARFKKN